MLLINYPKINIYDSARKKALSNKQIKNFKKSLLKIARDNCPRDTSNMAENAIYSISNLNGFKIIWDDTFAYYLPYVDKGINPLYPNSPKVKANKGFVARSIAFMHAYSGLFLYGETNQIKDTYGETVDKFYKKYFYFGNTTNKKNLVRESPLFVELIYKSLNGQLPMAIVKEKGAMMSNLIESLKRSITTSQDVQDLNDFINEYKEYEKY